MARKEWELEVGERIRAPEDGDSLFEEAVAERRRKRIERQEELDEAQHRAKMASLTKETASSEAAVQKIDRPEPGGFQIKGSMNLGNIDYQQMIEEQKKEREELRRQAEESAAHQHDVNDDLRERLHEKDIEILRTTFLAQQQMMEQMIKNNAPRQTFLEQLEATKAVAMQLGFSQGSGSAPMDMQSQIKLKELEFNQSVALRKMEEESKARDRQWGLELEKFKDEREARKIEAARQQEKDKMFANIPAMFGGAVARGLMDAEDEPSNPVTRQPQVVEAGIGESGEIDCSCGSKMGIGPTSSRAICASCGAQYLIKRLPSAQPADEAPAAIQPQVQIRGGETMGIGSDEEE